MNNYYEECIECKPKDVIMTSLFQTICIKCGKEQISISQYYQEKALFLRSALLLELLGDRYFKDLWNR